MKKIIAATVLLVGCTALIVSTKINSMIQQEEGKKMSRTKTASSLEYEILKSGSGASPKKGDTVIVHYTGWLNNAGNPGSKFDSSVDRGQPFSFEIGKGYVIAGWDEGVLSMKIGEKRRLFIPSLLGYGSRGAGRVIPPHSDLIFDVELLEIKSPLKSSL